MADRLRILSVGDPHIRVQDLEEAERLVDHVSKVALDEKVDLIVLMGDLFHTHSIMHVEVMHFWRMALRRLRTICKVYVILGNHDGPQEMRAGVHALAALEMDGVTIVDRPTDMTIHATASNPDGTYEKWPVVSALPYMRSNEEFVKACHLKTVGPVLYCHTEFDGCKYDNGFYSKTGVDPAAVPQKLIISGHIHSGQEFGKVWYVGAPRWMTASDVNQDRFIWVIDHSVLGDVTGRKPFPTDPGCKRMMQAEDTAEKPLKREDYLSVKMMVDVKGTAEWIEERKAYWKGFARVRTFATNERQSAVRESDGIPIAFRKYLEAYEPAFQVSKDVLAKMAHERLGI